MRVLRPQKDRIRGLDGLRALAALSVYGVHFNQIVRVDYHIGPFDLYRLLVNGDHGVSLFFTLSGFLLGLPFWRAMEAGKPLPSLKGYFVRRCARIIPSYYIALTSLIVLSSLYKMPGALADILLHYSFLFTLTEFSIFSINPPFWSIAVEMQFYLLLPCIFVFLRRWPAWKGVIGLLVMSLAAYFLHFLLAGSISRIIAWPFQPWLTWVHPYGAVLTHSLFAFVPHFFLGLTAGWGYLQISNKQTSYHAKIKGAAELVFWFSLVSILVILSTGLEEVIQIPHGRYSLPVVPLLLTALILSAPFSGFAGQCLVSFPLCLLGTLSYGIYLYHYPCLSQVDKYMAKFNMDAAEHWLLFALLSFLLTVLIAVVSFIVIERPLLRAARKLK